VFSLNYDYYALWHLEGVTK